MSDSQIIITSLLLFLFLFIIMHWFITDVTWMTDFKTQSRGPATLAVNCSKKQP